METIKSKLNFKIFSSHLVEKSNTSKNGWILIKNQMSVMYLQIIPNFIVK